MCVKSMGFGKRKICRNCFFDKETWNQVLILSPLKRWCFFGLESGKCDSSWLRDWKFPTRFGNKDQRCVESGHFLEYIHVRLWGNLKSYQKRRLHSVCCCWCVGWQVRCECCLFYLFERKNDCLFPYSVIDSPV